MFYTSKISPSPLLKKISIGQQKVFVIWIKYGAEECKMLAIWDTLTDIRKARSKRKEVSDRTTLCGCVGGLLLHTFLHAVSEGEYIFCALYRGAVCKKPR